MTSLAEARSPKRAQTATPAAAVGTTAAAFAKRCCLLYGTTSAGHRCTGVRRRARRRALARCCSCCCPAHPILRWWGRTRSLVGQAVSASSPLTHLRARAAHWHRRTRLSNKARHTCERLRTAARGRRYASPCGSPRAAFAGRKSAGAGHNHAHGLGHLDPARSDSRNNTGSHRRRAHEHAKPCGIRRRHVGGYTPAHEAPHAPPSKPRERKPGR